MVRLFVVAFPSRADDWRPVVFAVAILTLVVGSVLAVVQTNVKRMLAYSSISHAGFMLVGLEAAGRVGSSNAGEGTSAVLVYVMLYSVLVVGTFAVTAVVAGDRGGSSLEDFRGLSKRRPALALAMTILLLAQAGVPLTSGFVAKFGVIRAAVATESYVLAVAAMIAAVVAAYLYLRIMVSMWLAEPQDSSKMTVPFATTVTIAVSVAVTLVLGVFPALLLDSADLFATLSR
jgi:NADH-quinone oxidoreductase subunit N